MNIHTLVNILFCQTHGKEPGWTGIPRLRHVLYKDQSGFMFKSSFCISTTFTMWDEFIIYFLYFYCLKTTGHNPDEDHVMWPKSPDLSTRPCCDHFLCSWIVLNSKISDISPLNSNQSWLQFSDIDPTQRSKWGIFKSWCLVFVCIQ